jgi:hypothetical protein
MRERCGNDGAVESVESQNQASPSFHEPLGNLAKSGRDSHIPTAPATRTDGKVENQRQVFHFPTASIPSLPNQKTAGLRPAEDQRKETSAVIRSRDNASRLSGSLRIGINLAFQAHPALESILDFRLISGLENAPAFSFWVCDMYGRMWRVSFFGGIIRTY